MNLQEFVCWLSQASDLDLLRRREGLERVAGQVSASIREGVSQGLLLIEAELFARGVSQGVAA